MTKFAPLSSFVNGVAVFMFFYCILFLEQMNYYGLFLLLLAVGSVVFIPHFFVIQLIWRNLLKPPNNISRNCFILSLILCSISLIYIKHEYKNALFAIEKFKNSKYKPLEKTFMTEKILGMHFIYHTRFCEYDGWRPPKHEPILVIGMWLNSRKDPLNMSLKKRIELYKKHFPKNTYKFDCSCAIQYSKNYHESNLWEK